MGVTGEVLQNMRRPTKGPVGINQLFVTVQQANVADYGCAGTIVDDKPHFISIEIARPLGWRYNRLGGATSSRFAHIRLSIGRNLDV